MLKIMRVRIAGRFLRVIGARDDERGMALATVIILGTVLMLMSGAIVSVSVSGAQKSVYDANWNAAGAAAYAGVEDYQSKLANDNAYSNYGALGTGNSFSTGSNFTGTNNNPAFGLGVDTGTLATAWAKVDPSVASGGTYRYQVDNSSYSRNGILRLQSTGRVGNITRTVVANLKQSGFLDFLYFTDYEIRDPALTTGCTAAYAWAVSSRPNCSTIQFAPSDVISGPAHSNDTLSICGTTFVNGVTTGNPSGAYVTPASDCNNSGLQVSYKAIVQMPSTIGSLIQETRSDLTASTVPRPGCLYTGPTTITFNADATMTVYSPWTKKTNIQGNPVSGGSVAADCGTPDYSPAGNTLGSPGGQTLPVIDSNLIYVQNVPQSAGSGDPNYWSGKTPKNYSCTGADGSTAGNGVGYPVAGEAPPTTSSYSCANGDAFVKGTVDGNVTVAANNYLYVVNDVKYEDSSSDMLGLIGENNVVVFNPVKNVTTTGQCPGSFKTNCQVTSQVLIDQTKSDRTIDAAIMSVLHSFTVQNYDDDADHPKGKLTINGAIAQKFRGAVATTAGSGYAKNYQYDKRLAYQAPPKFLSPVSTTYGITQVQESKTAMSATGAPQ